MCSAATVLCRGQKQLRSSGQARPALYFRPHPLAWCSQFEDRSDVAMAPWDVIGSFEERQLLPGDGTARVFYGVAGRLERHFPRVAVRLWQYPMIVLQKTC